MIDLLRRAQVYALWNSSLEWLPIARKTLDTANVNPVGFVSGRRLPCGRCRATGRVRGLGPDALACQTCASKLLDHLKRGVYWHAEHGHGCRTCLLCDGTGWRLARRGETGEDEYRRRGHQDQADSFHRRVDRKRQQEAEIARLELTLKIAEGKEDPDWWLSAATRQKEHLYGRGSYHELDGVMKLLRAVFPLRHELVTKVEIHLQPIYISERTRDLIHATADWIAERMPAPIVVPLEYTPSVVNAARKDSLWRGRTDRHAQAREARRQRVITAHFDWGWTSIEIAQHESLTDRRVRQILAEHREHAGDRAAVATGPAA